MRSVEVQTDLQTLTAGCFWDGGKHPVLYEADVKV